MSEQQRIVPGGCYQPNEKMLVIKRPDLRHRMSMQVRYTSPALFALIAAMAPAVVGCGIIVYSGKEIRATVVDAETGQPVDGALVVAVWQLRAISGEGPRPHVAEAVTDATGAFFMPNWGPKLHPLLTEAHSNFPYLLMFKHGYVPVRLHNAPKSDFARVRSLPARTARDAIDAAGYEGTPYDLEQESVWNGMAIRMEPFHRGPEEWFSRLQDIQIHAGWRDVARTRRFHEALLAERDYFKSHPVDPKKVPSVSVEGFFNSLEYQLQRTRSP